MIAISSKYMVVSANIGGEGLNILPSSPFNVYKALFEQLHTQNKFEKKHHGMICKESVKD